MVTTISIKSVSFCSFLPNAKELGREISEWWSEMRKIWRFLWYQNRNIKLWKKWKKKGPGSFKPMVSNRNSLQVNWMKRFNFISVQKSQMMHTQNFNYNQWVLMRAIVYYHRIARAVSFPKTWDQFVRTRKYKSSRIYKTRLWISKLAIREIRDPKPKISQGSRCYTRDPR